MKKAPKSYLDCKRPPMMEAILLEGDMPIVEAVGSLEKKGYFTPLPRPWKLGFRDRGLGRGDFAVLDRFGDLVVETSSQSNAKLIISAVNANSQETIQVLEDEANQLEKWADETRTPMNIPTRLGNKMIARAKVLRSKIALLRAD